MSETSDNAGKTQGRVHNAPSQTVADGRDPRGRFVAGNKASQGNVVARKAAQCRAKLFSAVSMRDFGEIVGKLVTEAKAGQGWAIKLLFVYMLGDPLPSDIEERLAALETHLGKEIP